MSELPKVSDSGLISVREAAEIISMSESWVRRHINELPVVRMGHSIRFNRALLLRRIQCKSELGNRMEQKGATPMFQAVKTRYQLGRVYKRGKRAVKWYGQFRQDTIDADGKPVRVQKNVCLGKLAELPTKQAARRELERRMGTGTLVKSDMLFSDVVSRWRAAVVPTLRSTTADTYNHALDSYVCPLLGQRGIQSISRFDVELFLADKAKTYCRATIRTMRVALSRVLGWAVAGGWLERNPCAGVALPQAGTKVQRRILTPEQVQALASKLQEPYATLVLFLAVTGLRISEAVGVKKSDFEGNILKLRRRFYQGNRGGDYGELKTAKSARNLPLPIWLVERIINLRDSGEFCFQSDAGTPINQKNALRRYIHPACHELGFQIGGWHDFRHTAATWALKEYPTKTVAALLGHSSTRTTLDIYAHVLQEDLAEPLTGIGEKLLRSVAKISGAEVAA